MAQETLIVLIPWTGDGSTGDPYRVASADAWDAVAEHGDTREDITGQPVENIPPDVNVTVLRVTCGAALAQAITDDPIAHIISRETISLSGETTPNEQKPSAEAKSELAELLEAAGATKAEAEVAAKLSDAAADHEDLVAAAVEYAATRTKTKAAGDTKPK